MSRNLIKICGFCLRNSLEEGISFTHSKGRSMCKFYVIDDCCNDCVFSRKNQYEKDKKDAIQFNKKKFGYSSSEQRKSAVVYSRISMDYHGGNY